MTKLGRRIGWLAFAAFQPAFGSSAFAERVVTNSSTMAVSVTVSGCALIDREQRQTALVAACPGTSSVSGLEMLCARASQECKAINSIDPDRMARIQPEFYEIRF